MAGVMYNWSHDFGAYSESIIYKGLFGRDYWVAARDVLHLSQIKYGYHPFQHLGANLTLHLIQIWKLPHFTVHYKFIFQTFGTMLKPLFMIFVNLDTLIITPSSSNLFWSVHKGMTSSTVFLFMLPMFWFFIAFISITGFVNYKNANFIYLYKCIMLT